MTQPYVGEIRLFPWDWSVRGWATCSGQLLPIQQNQALFSLLGTTYGGNGVTTFALPDLRGRAAVKSGGQQNYTPGQVGGVENVTLNSTQIPPHTHQLFGTTTPADKRPPIGRTFGADTSGTVDYFAALPTSVPLNPQSIGSIGGNQPHNNMQPYLALNYSIALQGIFPSRN